ncbi:XAC2610-related protein [uncultured Dysosmobacter sp.]|uniref:XAC2610-related protein n=1 Tax=uncultured Dysosmobacter sp. TaxID=2591384 RepID=UPI0026202AF3|nr:hypothetical protein [uncultured Dysosmobacter sp.]
MMRQRLGFLLVCGLLFGWMGAAGLLAPPKSGANSPSEAELLALYGEAGLLSTSTEKGYYSYTLDPDTGELYTAQTGPGYTGRSIYGVEDGQVVELRHFWEKDPFDGIFAYTERGQAEQTWDVQWSEPLPASMTACFESTLPQADAPFWEETFAVGAYRVTLQRLPMREAALSEFFLPVYIGGTVTDASGQVIQTFTDDTAYYPENYTVEDVDFDGYLDFHYTSTRGAANWSESFWLYDPKTGLFQHDADLSGLWSPSVAPETQLVWEHVHFSAADWGDTCFRWVDGELTPLRSLSIASSSDFQDKTFTVIDHQAGSETVLWTVTVENYRDREDTPEVQAVWEEFTRYRDMDHLGPENPG